MRSRFVLNIVFYSLIVFQAILTFYLPLMHLMNDSAWYYMTVHYFETGKYIHESTYPSFDTASQYYPFLGYSVLLYITEKVYQLTCIDWALQLKWLQFILYIFSAIMARKIVFSLTNKLHLGQIAGILFLIYYPYFQYTSAVMSEIYAVFAIISLVWLFVKTKEKSSPVLITLMFLLGGYVVLIKPVFLSVTIIVTLYYIIRIYKLRKLMLYVYILPVLIFPVYQITVSKICYSNTNLQTGMGWHLWNRVIHQDGLIPESSEALDNLKKIYAENGRKFKAGYWWNVTENLSKFGYKEMEIQEICKQVAVDGIQENPLKYTLLTFRHFFRNFLEENENVIYYNSIDKYFISINSFAIEQHHGPLSDRLMQQDYYKDFKGINTGLRINYFISEIFKKADFLFHNILIFVLYIFAGIYYLYKVFNNRFRKYQSESLIWLAAFGITFGSVLVEYVQARLMLPALIFVYMIIIIFINDIITDFSNRKIVFKYFRKN